MTAFEVASLAIAAVSAFAAAIGIWRGIAVMVRANEERAAALEQQREADECRHAETMAALAEQGRALEALIRGMEAVIERTAPAAARESA